MSEQRRLAAIVSADVAGYSRLMGRDESGTLAALKSIRQEVVDPAITIHGGRIVKTTGDGLLLEFPSVVNAVLCAVVASLDAFWPLYFADRELRQVMQDGKAAIFKMTRFDVQDGERTDAAAIAEDERMPGIEANAGSSGHIGIIGKSLIQECIADNKGLTLEYGVTAKGIVAMDLANLQPDA